MKQIKVGYAAIIQLNFRGDKQKQFEISSKELLDASKTMHFETAIYPELIVTEGDAQKASDYFKKEGVDFLLVQNTSFASGSLIQHFIHTAPYLGLWAVEEQTAQGYLPQNSFCGINLNASNIREYLAPDLPYKWFFGSLANPLMGKRLQVTVKALTMIKNLQGSKVLHIGGTAPGFVDFYFDERKLLRKLGVRVETVEYGDLKAKALSYTDAEILPVCQEMLSEAASISDFAETKLQYNARVYLAVKDIMDESGAEAAAMVCWPRFRQDWSFTPCAAFGRLNQNGYITACEGDVLSAVSMLMLKYAAQGEPILMDLIGFDQKDDTMQLWHCGVASAHYAKGGKVGLDTHYNPGPKDPEKGWLSAGPVATMQFSETDFTCMRLTKDCDAMLLFRGDMINKLPVYHGSAGWAANLTQDGEKLPVLDLANTVMVNGYQHHYPLVRGNVEDVLREAAAWLGIAQLEKVPYRDYMQVVRGNQ